MGAPDSIYRLVEKFERHKPGSETEVRVQFVDELFRALGWDMRDKRQVRHEPRVIIKEAGFERSKRPDYSFHTGNPADFYVETKMPHVNLERNPIPAFQLRRYGWSGNAPVSVLTDFEEFSVYDCRIQPQRSDPAQKARLRYLQYGEYIDRWDELESRFSREAVARGALREWVEGERVRGLFSVDQAFLREMETWRESLAQEIALHNRELSRRQLNLLVQRTIDRIVFLRIAEDRDIEAYGRLRSAAASGKQVYDELKILFNEADDKYNSGLFHFGNEARASQPDTLSLRIHIPDAPLRRIISSLYFPTSPYEFSALSADILGQVYEQFLGKVIEISGGVRVEEKPEVRKAGGVYYTPAYIVDYIVENTVGDLLRGKSPKDAEKLRILDPACGSGSFLTGAYQYLLDWHLKVYSAEPRRYRNVIRAVRGRYVLTTVEKRRILENSIYGVDLDQNAVEVSKLSLLLKMLENEDGSDATGLQTVMFSAGERILPDLSGNIKWGNSLIGSDFYSGEQMTLFDDEALLKVKPFDWEGAEGFGEIMAAGGFDAVIGNPPYVRPHKIESRFKEYYWKTYSGYVKKSDLYCCFLEKSLQLLHETGQFGMIVSNSWLRLDSFEKIRRMILYETSVSSIIDFTNNVFADAAVKTNILLLSKPHRTDNVARTAITSAPVDLTQLEFRRLNQSLFESTYKHIFDLSIQEEHEAVKKRMRNVGQALGQLFSLSFGLKTGDDSLFLTFVNREDSANHKKLLRGENIARYKYEYVGEYVWYVPEYMKANRRTARPGTKTRFEQPKVLVRDTGEGLQCTFEDESYYVKDVLIVADENKSPCQLKYLAGLINSTLLSFYYVTSFPTIHVQRNELASLPIRTIDFDNPADVAMHDKMVALVDKMLGWHRQLPGLAGEARRIAQSQIERTDREIDELVYALYGLSEDEVGVVEGG